MSFQMFISCLFMLLININSAIAGGAANEVATVIQNINSILPKQLPGNFTLVEVKLMKDKVRFQHENNVDLYTGQHKLNKQILKQSMCNRDMTKVLMKHGLNVELAYLFRNYELAFTLTPNDCK